VPGTFLNQIKLDIILKSMDSEEKFTYWLNHAQYDLDTADVMYQGGRWLYVVFMSQQAVEKLCKGLYLLCIDDNVPRIHNISNLVRRFENTLSEKIPEETFDFFDRLTNFYLSDRYPEYQQNISSMINEQSAKAILDKTKEVFKWLLTLKP
jgi:HEPN domain-containing protein